MKVLKKKTKTSQGGFTLIEILTYVFIMSMLLLILSSMMLNVFNTRKILITSHKIHDNARFVVNFLNNRIHNVDIIDEVSPAPEGLHFYQLPDTRFSVSLEGDDLVFRETYDTGTGFPDQSSAQAVSLNSGSVRVDSFTLTPVSDAQGNADQGVIISFTLSTGRSSDSYGYLQKSFETFISLR